MKILIETIPHKEQRYDTVGDWFHKKDAFLLTTFQRTTPLSGDYLRITVSEQKHWTYEALVAIHELVEATLCIANDIPQEVVDAFDMAHPDADEPGSLPDCPYRREHAYAEAVERMVAAFLGVNWAEYMEAMK